MKFADVTLNHPRLGKPLQYGWMLRIDSLLELMQFFMEKDWVIKEAVRDFFEAAIRGRHFCNPLNQFVPFIVDEDGHGYTHFIGKLNGDRFKAMSNALPIYINRTGGWMPIHGCTENKTKVSDKWPEAEKLEPRYLQWSGGSHWYVKVGNDDVVVDGCQKWNTRESAECAYKKWISSR